ncbi:hypothetical protein BC827DRAFT_1153909 [Russula dissimulans]|nr:hypothetical protein BC827DRAFT_1153909 [Russula dissimulans]
MLSFSTSTLVCALAALCSGLTGFVLATGPRTVCVMRYNVTKGDTWASIEQEIGVNKSVLVSMNPSLDCNGPLTTGISICTRQYTPICTLNATATSADCSPLASKGNITTSNFVQYNDDVDSCGNITAGRSVRFGS